MLTTCRRTPRFEPRLGGWAGFEARCARTSTSGCGSAVVASRPGSVVGWVRGSLRSHLNQRVRVAVVASRPGWWWAGFEARCARTSTSGCGLRGASRPSAGGGWFRGVSLNRGFVVGLDGWWWVGSRLAALAPQPASAVCCGRVSSGLGGGLVSRLAALARCAPPQPAGTARCARTSTGDGAVG